MSPASRTPSLPARQELRDRDDWVRLVGGIVEVRLDGRLIRVGDATADSVTLWIEADAVEPRALFAKSCGYK